MNGFFKFVSEDKTLLYSFSFGLCLLTAVFVWLLYLYRFLPPVVPLFNQLPWGDIRVAGKQFIFMPVALAFFVAIANLLLSFYIYKTIPLLSRILSITFLTSSILVFIFIFKIVQIII